MKKIKCPKCNELYVEGRSDKCPHSLKLPKEALPDHKILNAEQRNEELTLLLKHFEKRELSLDDALIVIAMLKRFIEFKKTAQQIQAAIETGWEGYTDDIYLDF